MHSPTNTAILWFFSTLCPDTVARHLYNLMECTRTSTYSYGQNFWTVWEIDKNPYDLKQ